MTNKSTVVDLFVTEKIVRFDSQAAEFDRTRGLPDPIVKEIVDAVSKIAPVTGEGVLLEIGAGTGQIGEGLRNLPLPYVGLDNSGPMLERFRRRIGPSTPEITLIECDGNQKWPVGKGSVEILFSSRTLHLLPTSRVVQEASRVMRREGSYVILGRVRRDPESVKSTMRRLMQRSLKDEGIEGGPSGESDAAMLAGFDSGDSSPLRPLRTESWVVSTSPAQSIRSWREKEGLAGLNLDSSVKEKIFGRLERLAEAIYSDLDGSIESKEYYELTGIKWKTGY